MKRFVFLMGSILLALSLNAQPMTYTCRYWFDQNHAQAITSTYSESTWQAELDVGALSKGLHSLHLQTADTSLVWCPPQSYMFLKLISPESLIDYVDMSNLTYHCWFDQDDAHQQTGDLGNGGFMFDVSNLEEGLHSVNILLVGSALTSTQNYMFVKVAQQEPLIEPLDMSHLVYHCWFDQDYENRVIDSVSDGVILLDLEQITDGLHTVHVMLEGEALTSIQTYIFAKVPQPNSLIGPIDMTNPVYHCWFDQDYENHAIDAVSNGVILFDVDNLTDGLHTIHILLEGEALTSTQTYMFFKKPEHQDFGIAKWQYFLNGETSQLHTTEFSPLIDTLEIVTLLPVETWPVRSSCFHFHPNGDEPYLNAKNEITFRFWTNDDRLLQKTAFYVDYQVQQDIVASVFERNTTEYFATPRNNQIQWFKLDAAVGDSLAFVANKACTMQLFAPSGEEVYNVSGPESVVLGGLHAWEDGTYYLAVHDVMGSGETVSVTYKYLHKYAVLTYDVHLVGNGGCSTITFQGNGFNSLLNVYLVNTQTDTICTLDIGHESNTTTTATFNFYQVNLGVYDAVFEFYEEIIRINSALEVQDPIDIVMSSTVNYPSSYLRNTVVTYTYTITNNGNMTAYAVPIYLYLSNSSIDCISHIEIEGLDIMPLIDYFDLDSLSLTEIEELRAWSDEMGDDHNFLKSYGNDEVTGDPKLVRSNYFFINLAPFEIREIKIKITSDCTNDVWMTLPGAVNYEYDPPYPPDPYPPLVFDPPYDPSGNNPGNGSSGDPDDPGEDPDDPGEDPDDPGENPDDPGEDPDDPGEDPDDPGEDPDDPGEDPDDPGEDPDDPGEDSDDPGENPGGSSQNCCVDERLQCTTDLICTGLDYTSLIPGGWGIASSLGSCLCHTLSLRIEQRNRVLCPEYYNNQDGYMEALRSFNTKLSIGGIIASCLLSLSPAGLFKSRLQAISLVLSNWSLANILNPVGDCVQAWTKPHTSCPQGNPKGGSSEPVASMDPNDIHGYLSASGSLYMRQEIQNIHYEIEFENDTTLASAAAHTIIVRDTLDATKFDLSSLAAHSVTIGDKRLELNGEQNFARTLDMRPELYVIAQINQEYDPNTGIVVWTIQSLDPMTMEPTDNPHQGVLPVNYFGDGVGFIDYSVNLKAPFEDGIQVSNRAGIVFDQEEVIMTPTWTNTVDAVPPTSQMVEVTPVADSLVFVFNSEDNRSGVWYHTLYYRNDFTEMEWEIRKTMILENRFALKLDDLQTTEYYVAAVDSAGNVEPKEQLAEYVFSLEDHNYYTVTVVAPEGLGTTIGSGTYVENSDITIEAIPAEGYHFTQWNDGNTENPRTIHVTQDISFTAQFAINRYWVEVSSEDDTMGSVTGGAEYNHGTRVTVVAEANQGFHFVYWLENDTIASLDAVFNFVVTCPRSLTAVFATGNGNQITHTETLSAGWNWFSSFVEYKANTLSLLENSLSTSSTTAYIKSQSNGFASLEDNLWAGTLNGLSNEQMYLILVMQDAELSLSGLRINPQQHPITIESGWNWVGYLSPMTMPLDGALASFTPSENDIIKGQVGFSSYSEETGWVGSLTTLQPGQGYIYLNNSSMSVTLVYPKASRGYVDETPLIKHWSTNAHRFPTNLTMMVTLDENEFRLADGLYEIGAFVNGECRGSARIQYLESLGNYVAFLTVCGEEGEEISFRLFDVASNKVLDVIANEQIVYHADAVHGSLKAPMMLHFRNTGVNDEHHEVSLFPNPTTGKVTVKAVGMNRLTVTDVLGQVVFDTEVNADQIELNLSNCESGLYMIHVNTDAFTVVRRFVLAK